MRRGGSGLKLHVEDLRTLSLHLGPHTTTPSASIGVSVDYQPFFQVNVSTGANIIPLIPAKKNNDDRKTSTVVRINAEGWQNNRVNLQSIQLNSVCSLRLSCSIAPLASFIHRVSLCFFTGRQASSVFYLQNDVPVHWRLSICSKCSLHAIYQSPQKPDESLLLRRANSFPKASIRRGLS